jgi:hypothetical protein
MTEDQREQWRQALAAKAQAGMSPDRGHSG